VSGSRARQAGDNNGLLNLEIMNFRVLFQGVVYQQSIAGEQQ